MKVYENGRLLRIFMGENNQYEGKPLYEWIVLKAKEKGMAGATVLRGMMGFGANSRIHTTKILRLSEDLPVIVEIIDSQKKINEFIKLITPVINEGLVTLEKATIQFYRSFKKM